MDLLFTCLTMSACAGGILPVTADNAVCNCCLRSVVPVPGQPKAMLSCLTAWHKLVQCQPHQAYLDDACMSVVPLDVESGLPADTLAFVVLNISCVGTVSLACRSKKRHLNI